MLSPQMLSPPHRRSRRPSQSPSPSLCPLWHSPPSLDRISQPAMNYRAQPRPVPRSNSDLELDLPANLGAEFQERSVAYNQGQQPIPTVPATNVAPAPAPPKKKIALSIPPQVKDSAIAVSLWAFGWILATTIAQGIGGDLPQLGHGYPLGAGGGDRPVPPHQLAANHLRHPRPLPSPPPTPMKYKASQLAIVFTQFAFLLLILALSAYGDKKDTSTRLHQATYAALGGLCLGFSVGIMRRF
jgi:hypothetical protein